MKRTLALLLLIIAPFIARGQDLHGGTVPAHDTGFVFHTDGAISTASAAQTANSGLTITRVDTITAAQMTNLSTAPDTLIPAPGPGKVVMLDNVFWQRNASGHTRFAGASTPYFLWGDPNNAAAVIGGSIAASVITDTGDAAQFSYNTTTSLTSPSTNFIRAYIENQPIVLGLLSGSDFTGGTGTKMILTLTYHYVKLQ